VGELPVTHPGDVVLTRCTLRPLDVARAADVAAGRRAPDWAPDYPTEGDVTIARLLLEAASAGVETGPASPDRPWAGPWQVLVAGPDAVQRAVGGAGFHGPPDADAAVELGYGIAASARGRGVAADAARALCGWAEQAGAVVFADTDVTNLDSERVLAAAGFTPDAELTAKGMRRWRRPPRAQ